MVTSCLHLGALFLVLQQKTPFRPKALEPELRYFWAHHLLDVLAGGFLGVCVARGPQLSGEGWKELGFGGFWSLY